MQNNQLKTEQEMQSRGRKIFLLMLIFFIVPIIVVILMYKLNWKPNGVSLGELVNPPRLLNVSNDLKNSDGIVLNDQFWKVKWSVVYVTANCEKTCLAKLHDMRQLHVSLYKDIDRAQRVLITSTQDVTNIKHDFPDMVVINQPADIVLKLSQEFNLNNEIAANSNRLYLVDPLGHLMMSYSPSTPLADVRKDVTRLLRYSWAG